MKYRPLGKTGLSVSEIGLGGEWLVGHSIGEVKSVISRCEEHGINILDCWMSDPSVRSMLGTALAGRRERWIVQGHLGSTWQDGQYVRSRDINIVSEAFNDMLQRFQTDYIDLGMIHFVDEVKDFDIILNGDMLRLARKLKNDGVIRHIGMSSHNPAVAKLAAESGEIEVIMFSINPAFDMLPACDDIDVLFGESIFNDQSLGGIAPERDELYRICERNGVGITVMKGYGGGRLFSAETSPFGVALSPVQCLHYALTRPAVSAVMVGCDGVGQVDDAAGYETADAAQKDYASVLAAAPRHAYMGQCTYCGHCAPCPSAIDIAMVNKLFDLAAMYADVPATVSEHYRSLSANAADCIACGDCESRCPFGVRVIEKMETTAALFGKL